MDNNCKKNPQSQTMILYMNISNVLNIIFFFSGSDEMTAHYDWQANKTLSECNRHMLNNEIAFDVYFLVGENRQVVGAHRYVLVSRSCVFYAMLIGPMAGKSDEKIAIPDIENEVFQHMLE